MAVAAGIGHRVGRAIWRGAGKAREEQVRLRLRDRFDEAHLIGETN
jgi:hypothetical protein